MISVHSISVQFISVHYTLTYSNSGVLKIRTFALSTNWTVSKNLELLSFRHSASSKNPDYENFFE